MEKEEQGMNAPDTFALAPYENIVDPTTDDDGNKIQFTYDELDEYAQHKALDHYRDNLDYDWWGCVYEDAVTIGALMGVDIGPYSQTTVSGKIYSKPNIWFSGFYSQGDGYCFSGVLRVGDMKDALAKVKEHVGQDEELCALASKAEKIYNDFQLAWVKARLLGEEGNHFPPDSVNYSIEGNDRYYSTKLSDYHEGIYEHLGNDCDKFVTAFAAWIYDRLEDEHDHLTSDETVEENIRSNEYLFDEFGSPV
jgi:hypothetical protein